MTHVNCINRSNEDVGWSNVAIIIVIITIIISDGNCKSYSDFSIVLKSKKGKRKRTRSQVSSVSISSLPYTKRIVLIVVFRQG